MPTHLITLHGGCFTGGSVSWDQPQNKLLKRIGFIVHHLDFPKSSFEDALDYITNYVDELNCKNVWVLGRSSGGYLAKVLFDRGLFKYAIYLAPVFNPLLRASMLPKLGKKYDGYFKDDVPLTCNFDPDHELLLLATHDENVPRELFTVEQLNHAIWLGPATHKGITTTCSRDFANLIKILYKIYNSNGTFA